MEANLTVDPLDPTRENLTPVSPTPADLQLTNPQLMNQVRMILHSLCNQSHLNKKLQRSNSLLHFLFFYALPSTEVTRPTPGTNILI